MPVEAGVPGSFENSRLQYIQLSILNTLTEIISAYSVCKETL
jgi:hypothetical protein